MSNTKASKESRLTRCLKAPIRVLIKARDFYIQSMTECSGRVSYGSAIGCPTAHATALPKTFSVKSSKSSNDDEDFKELMRVASARSLGNKIELDLLGRQQKQQSSTTTMPRSHSVAIGKIDEDMPCEFGDDVKVKTDVFPRSRSYAVSKRTGVF